MHGWIFKEFFFKKIWTVPDGLTLIVPSRFQGNRRTIFKSGDRMWYSFCPEDPVSEECPTDQWLPPRRFSQGGFDAVYLGQDGRVIFVHCTTAKRHDTKLEYCGSFLRLVQQRNILHATQVEFYFVVPDYICNDFRVGDVRGADSFPADGRGGEGLIWGKKRKQIRDGFKIRGISGWITDPSEQLI